MRASIFLQILALVQWLSFSGVASHPLDVSYGPIVTLLIIIGLFLVSYHRSYWQKQLEFYALEAKYLGAYD